LKVRERTLGQLLAYLGAEVTDDKAHVMSQLSVGDEMYLQTLRKRIDEISSEDQAANIAVKIPKIRCQSEKPFLIKNEDFFLSLFVIGHQKGGNEKYCKQLSKHLNDCFQCFEFFTKVLQDYYLTIHELT
jgi:hypothetical protein